MLEELVIRNFAIIDDLKIRFSQGLTILSGETGAGKSIIINAVNLLLGSRATAKLIRTGAQTAELEALFQIDSSSQAAKAMADQGLDAAQGLLIRRIISCNDRHRIYINGRMATIQLLTSITQNLAGISGQHAHQRLLKEEQHLLILDQYAGLLSLRSQVLDDYNQLLPMIKKFDGLISLKKKQKDRIELLEFQKEEILGALILPEEDKNLEKERKQLKNRDLIFQTVNRVIETLYTAQDSIIERLGEVKKDLSRVGELDELLGAKAEIIEESGYQIEDLVEELRDYSNRIETDDQRLGRIEERLDQLNRLKRKYGGSLENISDQLLEIENQLSKTQNLNHEIKNLRTSLATIHERLASCAKQLSLKRIKACQSLAGRVEQELSDLQMGPIRFKIKIMQQPAPKEMPFYLVTDSQAISETGLDRVVFMIAPNPGEEIKPLAGIASGGELSRVVLALKAILARSDSVETIIFDEVDAGIGGSVAEVVGEKLADLSRYHQTICITHLPQIAKFGNHHYKISKKVINQRTQTSITLLKGEQRLEEIARMLGGVQITSATLAHAREMLGQLQE